MPGHPRVAVLGSGILGSSLALFLSRREASVTLIDAASQPFSRASRWNEGKIHLGYLYAADPSMRTARRVLPGGLAFKDLTEQLTGCSLADAVTDHDDTYLVHRYSIVPPDELEDYLTAVTALAAALPGSDRYFVDLTGARVRRLRRAEVAADYDPDHVVAGFRLPERSVATGVVADRFVSALNAEPRIHQVLGTRVTGVRRINEGRDGLQVDTSGGTAGPYDFVVNALWEGRLAVDAGFGMTARAPWTHRYRVALFVRTRSPVAIPSTVLVTGPFGDVKAYTPHDLYVSWYEPGLLAEGTGLEPPMVPALDEPARDRIRRETLAGLGRVIPRVRDLAAIADEIRVEGGWVFASGRGPLGDRASTLHRRDRLGIHRRGNYFSVDTGKYSTAPWLALQVAEAIVPR